MAFSFNFKFGEEDVAAAAAATEKEILTRGDEVSEVAGKEVDTEVAEKSVRWVVPSQEVVSDGLHGKGICSAGDDLVLVLRDVLLVKSKEAAATAEMVASATSPYTYFAACEDKRAEGDLEDLSKFEKSHDVIPGKYEGGGKVWESTLDLLELMCEVAEIEKGGGDRGGNRAGSATGAPAAASAGGDQSDDKGDDRAASALFEAGVRLCTQSGTVIDLGCGLGLVGAYALLLGSRVVFQDFNAGVITARTVPTVLANIAAMHGKGKAGTENGRSAAEAAAARAAYLSGDWGGIASLAEKEGSAERALGKASTSLGLLAEGTERTGAAAGSVSAAAPATAVGAAVGEAAAEAAAAAALITARPRLPLSFSLVLTAETIYAPPQLRKVVRFLRSCLAVPAGVAVVAAKRFYFGEGCEGGVSMFLEEIECEGEARGDRGSEEEGKGKYRLAGRVVRSIEDGSSNIRDVVLVQWVRSSSK